MKALLDTHTLLWFAEDDPKLSRAAKRLLETTGNEFCISPVSAVEICIKWAKGNLKLRAEPKVQLAVIMEQMELIPLPITIEHGLAVADLPLHHGDPFDRLLIAQARIERLPIISGDALLRKYEVKILW